MPIDYTVVSNPLTTPPSFSPRVVTRSTVTLEDRAPRIAERTSQSPEAVRAVFDAIVEEILAELLDGNAVLWSDAFQITPTLSGKIDSPTGDLPADSTAGLSLRALGGLLQRFKDGAQFTRVSADSTAPEILEVTATNADLQALRERDIVVLKGNRLSFDPAVPDEGVFFVPSGGGAAVRATVYLDAGGKTTRFQVPAGLTAGTSYTLRLDARRPGGKLIRSGTWATPVKAG
ncbi:MAG: DUF4469 domain-containing protein [Chthoniobacteraceae bacterium]